MAISLVASAGGPGYNGGAGVSLNSTGANFLAMVFTNTYTAGTFTDSKGNTWVECTHRQTGACGQSIWYCEAPTSVGASHALVNTNNVNSDWFFFLAFSVSGGNLSLDAGKEAYTDDNGFTVTSQATGALTPSADGALILAALSATNANATGYSISGGGFSSIALDSDGDTSNRGGAVAWIEQGTAASSNPTFSWTTASRALTALTVFKFTASGGGGGGQPPRSMYLNRLRRAA